VWPCARLRYARFPRAHPDPCVSSRWTVFATPAAYAVPSRSQAGHTSCTAQPVARYPQPVARPLYNNGVQNTLGAIHSPALCRTGRLCRGGQPFEPQLDVTFVAYPSSEPGLLGRAEERFTENRSIDGPIPFMVAECIRLLKRNMRRRSIVSGIFRIEEWEYPEEVLREALVNALVHRDYSEFARGTQVQVELYPDRLLIRNPGGLYGPVDVLSLGITTVTSSPQQGLLKILEDTPFGDGHMVCENRGTGVARMLVALTEAGMEPPSLVDETASFSAEFPNHTLLDEEAPR
jgi:predicted HTH transcriptional regulator